MHAEIILRTIKARQIERTTRRGYNILPLAFLTVCVSIFHPEQPEIFAFFRHKLNKLVAMIGTQKCHVVLLAPDENAYRDPL